jgi:hypothetical protein
MAKPRPPLEKSFGLFNRKKAGLNGGCARVCRGHVRIARGFVATGDRRGTGGPLESSSFVRRPERAPVAAR